MNSIGALAGSAYSGLTYQNSQVRQIFVQVTADTRNSLSDITGYYVRDRLGNLVPARSREVPLRAFLPPRRTTHSIGCCASQSHTASAMPLLGSQDCSWPQA